MANISLISAPVQAGKRIGKLLSLLAVFACLLACWPTIASMFKLDTGAFVDMGDELGNKISSSINRARIDFLKREVERRSAQLKADEANRYASLLQMPSKTRNDAEMRVEESLNGQRMVIAHLQSDLTNASKTQVNSLQWKLARQKMAHVDQVRKTVDELLQVQAMAGTEEKAVEDATAADAEAAVNDLFDLFSEKNVKLSDIKAVFLPKSRITASTLQKGRVKLAALSDENGFAIEVKPGFKSNTFDVFVNGEKLTTVEQRDGSWLFKTWF